MNTSSAQQIITAIEAQITGGQGEDREPGSADPKQGMDGLAELTAGVIRLLVQHGRRYGTDPACAPAVILIGTIAGRDPNLAQVVYDITRPGNAHQCRIAAIRCFNRIALAPRLVMQTLQSLLNENNPHVVFTAAQTWLEIVLGLPGEPVPPSQPSHLSKAEVAERILNAFTLTDASPEIRCFVAGMLFDLLSKETIKLASAQPIAGASTAEVVFFPAGTILPPGVTGNAITRDGRILEVDSGVAVLNEAVG